MEALNLLSLIRTHSQTPISLPELKCKSQLEQEVVKSSLQSLEESKFIQRSSIKPQCTLFFCRTIFEASSNKSNQVVIQEEKKAGKEEEDVEIEKLRAEWKRKSKENSNNLRKSKNDYFKALREYNYLKDLAHGLAEILSQRRSCASREVLEEFEFKEVEKQ